ncbi:MAG TPA: glucoamylase family protein [Candidatus Limnocylindrales bacterium]|jgi:hypothetical protein
MLTRPRAPRLHAILAGVLTLVLALPAVAAGTSAGFPPATGLAERTPALAKTDKATLLRYARDTWASFVAMTDPVSGLPADALSSDGTTSVQTSTTNIGAYLWSTLVAERLGIIGHEESIARLETTLGSLETMERDQPSGQYFNWYDHHTGAVLTVWPSTGDPVTPILSSVDNGWLAAALHMVATSVPEVSSRATALFASMHFGFYYRPVVNRIAFHVVPSTGVSPCCYDTIVSESRIASYIGIFTGEIPAKEYFGAWRTFPASCDWSWQETQPVGVTRSYLGVSVFEGAYPYDGMRIVPGWGGSMFEALMPALFVPEEEWGPKSWGLNHPLTVAAQIHHGLQEAAYGYWGFSPANIPEGGYSVYGVDALGMNPEGYPSNEDNTFVDHGFGRCRDGRPDPPATAYTNGVVTPHAAFLALRWAPNSALDNLGRLEADFPDLYGTWGFRDTVNVDSGTVSDAYLSLDQGIIMAAVGNALGHDMLRRAFATPEVEAALQPVISMEKFGAGPVSRALSVDGP